MVLQNDRKTDETLMLDPHLWACALGREKRKITAFLVLAVSASLAIGHYIPGTWQSSALLIISPTSSDNMHIWASGAEETMAENLKELAVQDEVLINAGHRSGMDDLSEWRTMIRAQHPEGTNLIRITAVHRNPETAEKAAQAAAEASGEVIGGSMGLQSLRIVSGASKAKRVECMSAVQALLYGLSVWAVISMLYLMFLMYQYPLLFPESGQFPGIRICRTMQDVLFCCSAYPEVFVIRADETEEDRMVFPLQAKGTVFVHSRSGQGFYEQCIQAGSCSAALLQIRETASRMQILDMLKNAGESGVNMIGVVSEIC